MRQALKRYLEPTDLVVDQQRRPMTTTTIDAAPRPAAEASAARSSAAWPAKAIKPVIGWIAQTWRIRRDSRALAALDERQLADMGLCREDVERRLPRDFLGVTWKLW
jgi:uncharacterized protein YjiS (DUF1127 family)